MIEIIKYNDFNYYLTDHGNGFDQTLHNKLIDSLPATPCTLLTEYFISDQVKNNYPNISFELKKSVKQRILGHFVNYNIHPQINYKNFICSFNGSDHVSRKLLVSILKKFGYFNTEYCSKNFAYSTDILDGHIQDYVPDQINFYRKFFISLDSEDFFQSIINLNYTRYDHKNNIYNLENKLTESFLHIVSETMATSYHPFVTEKFLYSIVTRGLFLAYAHSGWHEHLETYFGFKRYTKLFDYKFDTIQNPVERLVELMTMVSKFSNFSTADWHDLYLLEQDTIEYNYDHYFSGDYLTQLKQYEDQF
jgi:hypothetical protein